MEQLWIRIQAPFAAFRYFQAGVFRATSPTIPFSAAWGLVLNLAGIDIRMNENNAITEINPASPNLLMAIGSVSHGEKNTLYQQLHTYPVGESGKEFAERTKGNKFWIAPAKREFLVNLDAMIGVQTDDKSLLDQIRRGLKGDLPSSRYGLPFAGDNNLLFDRIEILSSPAAAYWYVPVVDNKSPTSSSCRLSIKIDRLDSSKTVSKLFAPQKTKTEYPPDEAWIWTPDQ